MNTHQMNVKQSPPLVKICMNLSPNSPNHNKSIYGSVMNSSFNNGRNLNSSITPLVSFNNCGSKKPLTPNIMHNITLVQSRHQNIFKQSANLNYPNNFLLKPNSPHLNFTKNQTLNNPSQSRYSKQLNHIKEQILFLGINIKRLQQEVSLKKTYPKKTQLKNSIRQNQLCLSFAQDQNQDQIKYKNIKLSQKQPNDQIQWYQHFSEEKSQKLQQYVNPINQTEKKINQIYKKLCDLQNFFQITNRENSLDHPSMKNKCINNNLNESSNLLDSLLKKIKQKSGQLEGYLQYQQDDKYIANLSQTQQLPEQWKRFESIINCLIYRVQSIINQPNNIKMDFNKIQFDKLSKQNYCRQIQNQRLKLQYSQLKNQMLNFNNQSEQMQKQLNYYRSAQIQLQSEIQRLQQLILTQNQKIQLMSSIMKKKEDIQNQYNQIFQTLNKKNQEQQNIINQMKEQKIKTQQIQNSYQRKNEKLHKENCELIALIKSSYDNSDLRIKEINERLNENDKINNQFIIKFVQELSKLLQIANDQLISEESLKKILQIIKDKNYEKNYCNYVEVVKLFGINIEDKHCHQILMGQIQLFRTDIQILFSNIQQLTLTNKNQTIQNQKLKEEILSYKLKLQQATQYFQSQKEQINPNSSVSSIKKNDSNRSNNQSKKKKSFDN